MPWLFDVGFGEYGGNSPTKNMLTVSLVFSTMLSVAGKISRGYRLEDRKRDRTMVGTTFWDSWLGQIFLFTSLVKGL